MAGGAAEPESLLPAVALSLPFGIFFPGCWSGAPFPARPCSTVFSICRWCCLRWWWGTCCCWWPWGGAGFIGSWLYDWFGISFAFSWRGAVLAAAVMSFPLMVRAIRPALEGWTSNWSKRREPSGPAAGGYFDHYVAVDSAGDYCRHGAGLRPLVRGVWRDHHVRLQYSR